MERTCFFFIVAASYQSFKAWCCIFCDPIWYKLWGFLALAIAFWHAKPFLGGNIPFVYYQAELQVCVDSFFSLA